MKTAIKDRKSYKGTLTQDDLTKIDTYSKSNKIHFPYALRALLQDNKIDLIPHTDNKDNSLKDHILSNFGRYGIHTTDLGTKGMMFEFIQLVF